MTSSKVCSGTMLTKSTIVVIPPAAAARVPEQKSSLLTVPATGSSMWVCGSMKPGKTYLPAASITSAASSSRPGPIATIDPPSTATSACRCLVSVTTSPFRIRRSTIGLSVGLRVERCQNLFRCHRQRVQADADRVVNRVGYCRSRAVDRNFGHAFCAKRSGRLFGLHQDRRQLRHVGRGKDFVVHEARIQYAPVISDQDLFGERVPQPLGHRALNLSLANVRVERPTNVHGRHNLDRMDLPGLYVDLDLCEHGDKRRWALLRGVRSGPDDELLVLAVETLHRYFLQRNTLPV